MSNNRKIAYLAPEIPGLSSTFVYQEVFALLANGQLVSTYSLHETNFDKEAQLIELSKQTVYLYKQTNSRVFHSHIKLLITAPLNYISSLFKCLNDCISVISKPKISLGLLYRFYIAGFLANDLKVTKVDHLHVHFAHVSGEVGMYAGILANIDFSITMHANDIFQQGRLLKQKGSRSKFIATISNFNIDFLVAQGIRPEKLKLIRCGVNPREFIQREFKHKNEITLFGFLGRLVEKKGISLLLDAIAELSLTESNFILEIAGDGPDHDSLMSKFMALGLDQKVQFSGVIRHSDVSNWMAKFDYFILPAVKDSHGDMDGIPVVLMEAMLTGVPVISTDISGIPELVIPDLTGLVAHSGDLRSLAVVINRAIQEPEKNVRRRIESAREHIQYEFTIDKNIGKLQSLFQDSN
jgi:colanic acid/amylovoran biosynthesis glycosyltransferase